MSIRISNLTKKYGGQTALNNISFEVSTGEVAGFLGTNGAGKTTFFNAIFGLKRVLQGKILYNNKPLPKKELAYLQAENFFYSNITGREYLSLFRNPDFDANQWNQLFTLPLDQIIDEYYTGMKKKLALLGVIKQNKPVVVLDEPFNGLDIEM